MSDQQKFPVPILTYHHISDSIDYYTCVKQKVFEQQIRSITGEFEIINFADAITHYLNGTPQPGKVVITIDDGYQDSLAACNILDHYNATATLFIPTSEIGKDNKWNHKAPYIAQNLTADQIINLHKAGYTIGSHGRTHQNLPKLDNADLDAEIGGSKKDLTSLLGPSDYFFCYPFGVHNHRVRKLVSKHYPAAVATNKTCENKSDLSQLYRLSVNVDTSIASIMEYLHGK